jgi:hypothetical protein
VQQFQNCRNERFVLDESLGFHEGNNGRLASTPTTDVEPGGLEKPRLCAWINDVQEIFNGETVTFCLDERAQHAREIERLFRRGVSQLATGNQRAP